MKQPKKKMKKKTKVIIGAVATVAVIGSLGGDDTNTSTTTLVENSTEMVSTVAVEESSIWETLTFVETVTESVMETGTPIIEETVTETVESEIIETIESETVETEIIETKQSEKTSKEDITLDANEPSRESEADLVATPVIEEQPEIVPSTVEQIQTTYVWLPATGEKYHSINNCGRMNPDKARQVTLDEAIANNYERCPKCN